MSRLGKSEFFSHQSNPAAAPKKHAMKGRSNSEKAREWVKQRWVTGKAGRTIMADGSIKAKNQEHEDRGEMMEKSKQ